jgi:hypothetical protein
MPKVSSWPSGKTAIWFSKLPQTMAFKGRFQPLCRTRVRKVKKPGESDRITVRPLHDCLALR